MLARKIYKGIAFAFPSSVNAELLGFNETGCYHIEQVLIGIEGSDQCQTIMPHNAEGYLDKNDPDLLAQLAETEGKLHKDFTL